MTKKRSQPLRKPRADAERNRERILEVAKEAFARDGASASLDDIAKQAGVGPGTLYRHFPTREELLKAVLPIDLPVNFLVLSDTGKRLPAVRGRFALALVDYDLGHVRAYRRCRHQKG